MCAHLCILLLLGRKELLVGGHDAEEGVGEDAEHGEPSHYVDVLGFLVIDLSGHYQG
jgi:hypothetical protein